MTDVTSTPAQSHRWGWTLALTLGLVAAADYLGSGGQAGINHFVFAVAAGLAIALRAFEAGTPARTGLWLALAVVAAAPLIEAPSLSGVIVAGLGLALAALAGSRLLPAAMERLPGVLGGFLLLAPVGLAVDGLTGLRNGAFRLIGQRLARRLIVWVVPGLCALLFLALFMSANPLIDNAVSALDPGVWLTHFDVGRIGFWMVVAVAVWPLLRPQLLRSRPGAAPVATVPGQVGMGLFGTAAILRSLIVFNALFAVQTALDLAYLWGGVALPEGVSFADYAHRGAYPLIVTALLAAAFVLAAMRPGGPWQTSRLTRGLVYAWIAQNIWLCISSLLRLDLYVDAYSLTELRIAAAIWMGLVAVGLLLILLRIALRRSNAWLVATNLIALAVTFYGCSWMDFSALTARFNVEHSHELSGEGVFLDIDYLRSLGPTAVPALDAFIAASRRPADVQDRLLAVRDELVAEFRERPADWRGWSWRAQRLGAYLDANPIASTGATRDNGGPPQ